LRVRTRFRRYRGCRVPFSCFARPDSLLAATRAPGLAYGGNEGVGSRLNVLRARTHFRQYRGHRVPFSCFARPDSFSAVPSATGPILMFIAPGLVFGGTESVTSRFHVLHARTHFRRYRGLRVTFSCFARSDSFSTVPRASGPILMFSAPVLVFDRTKGVGSRFHVLRAMTHFWPYRG
jgi:hypothetical protein